MREIPIFIASSIREFQYERLLLSPAIERLNNSYKNLGVQLKWNRPETQDKILVYGGSQLTYDEYIRQCEIFVLIVGNRVGTYTRHELNIALERFRREKTSPVILPCFLKDANGELSDDAANFLNHIKELDIGAQFVSSYKSFEAILLETYFVLTEYVAYRVDFGDEEAVMDRAKSGIVRKIHSLQVKIADLKSEQTTPQMIADTMAIYARISKLVQKAKVSNSIVLTFAIIFTFFRLLQDLKTFLPINLIDFGRIIICKLVQPAKAPYSI